MRIQDDEVADRLTDEADDRWFTVFDMQEVAPDLEYAVRYADYCKELGIEAVILLAETSDGDFEVKDDIGIAVANNPMAVAVPKTYTGNGTLPTIKF